MACPFDAGWGSVSHGGTGWFGDHRLLGGDMLLVGIIVGVLVVLLVAAALFDWRARRVRGRSPRVRVSGGELQRKRDSVVGLRLSKFDAGQPMASYTRHRDQDTPDSD
jgi:hypothetical protein